MNQQSVQLPGALASAVQANLQDWLANNKVSRLWQRDATLWTGEDEAKWLGWLDVVQDRLDHVGDLEGLAQDVHDAKFSDILLLGMGGSSLCPEVLEKTFGRIAGFPQLHILDSTDPAQVSTFEHKVNLPSTLCVVSSKSGSTLEPNIFEQYFFQRIEQSVGAGKVCSHFIAITDPGSKLEQTAQKKRFRGIFAGVPSIGGRYSALSNFGMVPAALMGMDVAKFLSRSQQMVDACGASVPADLNPGVMLGIALGSAAKLGRDKVTIIASPGIFDLGAWLEQLLAESTGKQGKGIIPVDREGLEAPGVYGDDRFFVYLRLDSEPAPQQDAGFAALVAAGHPAVQISVEDRYNLGQEFFRWEIATAVAGSILGIDAFNQPDVEASKIATRNLTEQYEKTGSLPAESPILEDAGIKLFTDSSNAATLAGHAREKSLLGYLRAHLDRLQPGDYFALLAYLEMDLEHETALQQMRHVVRDRKHVATCLGFGPRFLHSTGQAYKGGPNTGVFLQITCDDAADLPIPGQKYTFGVVKSAQARGDFQVLVERKRRALRVHLGKDLRAGLDTLRQAFDQALK
jgi:transaldolase/glucose-6-phosphate isomerase